jgi:A/G-specific adenine glycosylase
MMPGPASIEADWVADLLRWYAAHRRAMPWRSRPSSYRVWVSEIMLQQTQVATALPYFQRFVRAFPSVRALAAADLQAVLKAWEGLGYYARARNFHRAAKLVAGDWRGRIPRTAAELRRLPGVGAYTAAAMASICFGEPVPAVDGNVLRVFARLLGIRTDARGPQARARIDAFLQRHIPRRAPGDFNQAVMELGALVCRPRRLDCAACPLRVACVARRTGQTATIPRRRPRPPVPHVRMAVGVVRSDGRVLILRRGGTGLLGGLWEFPNERLSRGETPGRAVRRALRKHVEAHVDVGECLAILRHAYSHFRVTVHVLACRIPGPGGALKQRPAAKWVTTRGLDSRPMSVLNRRIAAIL